MPIFSSEDDGYGDLLCSEEADILDGDRNRMQCSNYDPEFPEDSDESIAGFIEGQTSYSPAGDYPARFRSSSLDPSARQDSIAWILKVQTFYDFRPLTAYLSINYMDRFLSSHSLPQARGWPLQLLAVACLSLAAKMEEPLVPSLLDLQIEGTRFIFEPRIITRMELLVLNALQWRLRSVTPFTFIDYLAYKADPTGIHTRCIATRATQISLATVTDIEFLGHCPSSIAAAAIICANNEIPDLNFVDSGTALTWCTGLTAEGISSCCRLMQDIVTSKIESRRPPRILPHLRVTTPTITTMASESSTSSSSSSSQATKRRKLSNHLWVDGDKESSL